MSSQPETTPIVEMEDGEKLPKKKTMLVGMVQVIIGMVSVMCNVAIHYLPTYDYPIKNSSYGVWGGLTFLLSGLAVMNATRGYSQAAVSTALSTVSAGMALVIIGIGAMAIHDGAKAVIHIEEGADPVDSVAIARFSLDIVITFIAVAGFVLAIVSHKLTMKAFKKYLRELQQEQYQDGFNEFPQVQVRYNAREETCSVPIGPPSYPPPDDPYPPPPAYTEKVETPPESRRLGTHQMNRSTESLVASGDR